MPSLEPDRLVRRVSHVSPMSVFDGFIYNFLAMGVIFPWVYVWGLAAFPGACIWLAVLLAFAVQVPLSVAYSFIAAAIPRDGGDYVYQTLAFRKIGTVAVLSGFFVWILQWVALSGWLFSTLGLTPLLMSLAAFWNSQALTKAAVITESPGGVIAVSLILCAFSVLLLKRGLAAFARIQRVLFVLTMLSVVVMAAIFLKPQSEIVTNLNHFVGLVAAHLTSNYPSEMKSAFVSFLQRNVIAYGFNPNPPFSLLSTLCVVPIAWTGLQWATYSVEQNEDIKGSHQLSAQLFMLLGSAAAVAVVLILIAALETRALGTGFLTASSAAYWDKLGTGSPEAQLFVRKVLPPFPNVLAIAASRSLLASFVIALGFLANAFQVSCNCFIGMSKIMIRMNEDGLFPDAWRLSYLDPKTAAPTRAYLTYALLAVPVIFGYSLVTQWADYTLGVTLAGGYVFMLSAMAIAKLSSDPILAKKYPMNGWASISTMRVSAQIGGLLAFAMVVSFLVVRNFGLRSLPAYGMVAIVICACAIWTLWRSATRTRSSVVISLNTSNLSESAAPESNPPGQELVKAKVAGS